MGNQGKKQTLKATTKIHVRDKYGMGQGGCREVAGNDRILHVFLR